MNNGLTAKELRAAAALAESRMLAELGPDEASPHEFSEAFELKMEPVLKKARRMERARQTARTIAASLAVVVLFGLIWIATHAEAREAVQKWFTFTWNNIISYRFTEEYTDEFPTYRPTWIPDGYEETDVFEIDGYCNITYKDDNGSLITFFYQAMDDGSDVGIMILPDDEVEIKSVLVQGLPGDFYIDTSGNKPSSLIWMDDQNKMAFGIDSKLSPDVIMQIAESVSKVKHQK